MGEPELMVVFGGKRRLRKLYGFSSLADPIDGFVLRCRYAAESGVWKCGFRSSVT